MKREKERQDNREQSFADSPIIRVIGTNNRLITKLINTILEEELNRERELLYNNKLLVIADLQAEQELDLTDLKRLNSDMIAVDIDRQFNLNLVSQYQAERLIYCSSNSNNLILQHQFRAGQAAVYTTEDNLVLFDGVDKLPIIALERLKEVTKGDREIILGILFAVAAAFVLEIPFFIIRFSLEKLTLN
ncbi:MAG: hypothetical protein R6V17_00170 [Halanaerobacter sp.]